MLPQAVHICRAFPTQSRCLIAPQTWRALKSSATVSALTTSGAFWSASLLARRRGVLLEALHTCAHSPPVVVQSPSTAGPDNLLYRCHRPALAKGFMQLYSFEQQKSQPLEAHAAAFATVKASGRSMPLPTRVQITAFAGSSKAAGEVQA